MADDSFTCPDAADIDASETCTPGCDCPVNMVEHNGGCIMIEECPCYFEGKVYDVISIFFQFLVILTAIL